MLFAGEIVSIDYVNHECSVNIPDYKGVNDGPTPVTCTAEILETPGTCQGFSVGDKVWLSLIRGEKHAPVVIGLMNESTTPAAALIGKNLKVSDSVELPNTITFTNVDTEYNSLVKIINKLKTSSNFIERYIGLEFALDDLAKTGGGTGWENITAIQSEDSMETDFPIGKILFVRDNLGKKYSLWTEMDVFPVYSNSATDSKNVEFSNGQHSTKFQKLPGCWRIKAFLDGGFLVQRCQESTEIRPSSVVLVGNGSFAIACDLYNQDKEALSWYWVPTETGDGRELKSILSKDLVYFTTAFDNKTRVALRDSTKNQIFEICVPKEHPFADEDPYQVIQNFKGSANERVDSLAILNLDYAGADQKLLNKDLLPCKFESNGTQNSVFNSGSAGFGPEYIYLPDNYFNTYTIQNSGSGTGTAFTYTRLDNSLFMTARNLVEIFLPENTGYIDAKVFSGTGERRRGTVGVRILNLENTHVHFFGFNAFQNIRLEHDRLKLPKKPLLDKITFDAAVFSYVNWPSNVPTLKTLYVYSAVDFDHMLDGTEHSGAFYCANAYINRYVKELVYPITNTALNQSTYVLNLLKESSLLSFLKTDTNGDVTQDHVTELLNKFEAHCSTANASPDITFVTGDGEAKLRFVDMQRIDTIYTLGSATIPTILYNCNEKSLK